MKRQELTFTFDKKGKVVGYKLNGKEMKSVKPHTRIHRLIEISHLVVVHHVVNGRQCVCVKTPTGWKQMP